jgi:hypothetical protein
VGSNNITGTNTSVVAAPSWAIPTNADYEWISYGDTGCGSLVAGNACPAAPASPAATTITGTPTAIFYQTFTLSSASAGTLDVWADDTAGVWLDTGTADSGDGSGGVSLAAPDGTLGTHCANGPIGCTTGNDAVIPLSLSAGTYTLVIDAYQLVSDTPFGVMYDGELTPNCSNAPEPASYMLMGLGLVVLGAISRAPALRAAQWLTFALVLSALANQAQAQCVVTPLSTTASVEACLDHPHAARWHKLYQASVAALVAGNAADAASSWGKFETNPTLGRGTFGARQTGIKLGAMAVGLAYQHWQVARRPAKAESFALGNLSMAAVFAAVAVHNLHIPDVGKRP